jgi:hypothetical protein
MVQKKGPSTGCSLFYLINTINYNKVKAWGGGRKILERKYSPHQIVSSFVDIMLRSTINNFLICLKGW